MIARNVCSTSSGNGNMMIELRSLAISPQRAQVAQLHSPGGLVARISVASTSFCAACCSPSALMTLARRRRSASA